MENDELVFTKTKTSGSGDKPLERYARILEVLSGFPEGVSPTAIAEILDLPKATIYRLIKSLADVGLVELTAPPAATCKIGDRLNRLLLSGSADEWLKSVSAPILKRLAERTGEACFLARYRDGAVKSLQMYAPDSVLRAYIMPGHEIPLNAGAAPKAILAYLEETELVDILNQPMHRFTEATKVEVSDIRAGLAEVREAGVSYCIGEDIEGFAGIAAPVSVEDMPIRYSICVSGTIRSLIDTKKDEIVSELKQASQEISIALSRHRSALAAQ